MNDLRKAAQQALDEMLRVNSAGIFEGELNEAIAALKQALAEPEQEPISLNNGRLTQYPDGSIGVGTPAEPEQEPVAWAFRYSDGTYHDPSVTKHSRGMVPLYPYTAPTPRRPLTDEQCDSILLALDEWARDFDHHDYGLPLYSEELRGKAREVMRIAHGIGEQT